MQNNENIGLNDRVNAIMEEVYKKMSISETCDTLIGLIEDKFFVFAEEKINEQGEATIHTIDVRKVLSDAQMENIKQIIIASIRSNKADSDAWLEQFAAFKPQEPKKQFADGTDAEEEEEVIEEERQQKKEISLDTKVVEKLLNEGLSQRMIAEELGASKATVQRFIAKNNLKKKASTPSKNK